MAKSKDEESRVRWAEIESSIEAKEPQEWNLEWGSLRQKFYEDGGTIELPDKDTNRLKTLKDKYKGKRIFIIGNGPSLNKTPLHLLKGEYTFGANRIYLLYDKVEWKPTFYTALDWRVVPDIARQINGMTGSTFFFEERFRAILRGGSDIYYYTHSAADPNFPEDKTFSYDVSRGLRGAGSVVGTAIQLAYYMGFDPIYLIGCDLGYKVLESVEQEGEDRFGNGVKLQLTSTADDDPNHFDSRYFGVGRKWHDPNVKRMIEGHLQCKHAIEKMGRSIFNATVGGELEVYDKIRFSELFDMPSFKLFPRSAHAHLDETSVVYELFNKKNIKGVMLDVGAHHGHSAKEFVEDGWKVICFEPDPSNRAVLERRLGKFENITIDNRAVGEIESKEKPYFASEVSSGISGMLAFHDSHKQVGMVDVTNLTNVVGEHKLAHIDFLKIDVEGMDYSVLKGFPWKSLKPDIVECEFEDLKTTPQGHNWREICDYLVDKGYTVYVSEWHPIIRYGVRHDWLGMKRYPCELNDANAWGNLLAFLNDPGIEDIQSATLEVISLEKRGPNEKNIGKTESNGAVGGNSAKELERVVKKAADELADTSVRKLSLLSRARRRTAITYHRFADFLRELSPNLFLLAKFSLWSLRRLRTKWVSVLTLTLSTVLLITIFYRTETLNSYLPTLAITVSVFFLVAAIFLLVSFARERIKNVFERQKDLIYLSNDKFLSELQRLKANSNKTQSELNQQISGLESEFVRSNSRSHETSKELNEKISQVLVRMGNLISGTENTMSGLNSKISVFSERFNKFEGDIQTDLSNFSKNISDLTSDFNDYKSSSLALADKLESDIQVDLFVISDKVSGLTSGFNDFKNISSDRIDKLESEIQADLSGFADKFSKMATDFDEFRDFSKEKHQQISENVNSFGSKFSHEIRLGHKRTDLVGEKVDFAFKQLEIQTAWKHEIDEFRDFSKEKHQQISENVNSLGSKFSHEISLGYKRIDLVGEKVDFAFKQLEIQTAWKHEIDELSARFKRLEENIESNIIASNELKKTEGVLTRRLNTLSVSSPFFNFRGYQTFNRRLEDSHMDALIGEWCTKLGLEFNSNGLSYIAHKICVLESMSRGRLAANIEDAVLRVLVAAAAGKDQLKVLEIGTLFGVGLAMICTCNRYRYKKIDITALDPLEGYYGAGNADIATSEVVCESTFIENMKISGIPDADIHLIKKLSTSTDAKREAAKSKYDLLIIDGDHSYVGVRYDFENYCSLVKRNGYIVFDDYGSDAWPDIKRYVDQLVETNKSIKFIGAGWHTAVVSVIK